MFHSPSISDAKIFMKKIVFGIMVAIATMATCAGKSGKEQTNQSVQASGSSVATIPSDQIFTMRLDTPLHTRITKKGDKVEFHAAEDLIVDRKILLPYRSAIRAEVTKSKRAGRLFGRAEIQVRLMDVQLSDGTVLPLQAVITRVGFDPVDSKDGEVSKLKGEGGLARDIEAAAKAGTQGAIIGAIHCGAKGALYSGAVGATATAVEAVFRRGSDLDLPRNTLFEARLEKPLDIPANLVLAQNSPHIVSPRSFRILGAEEPPDDPPAAPRPVLKRPPKTKPPEKAPAATPVRGSNTVPPLPAEHTGSSKPASGKYTISVNVKMVQVDAVVRDSSGRTIEGLRLDDFRVYEDNELQELVDLSQDELPLAVAIVVDRSGSVSPYITELRRIATRVLYNLKMQDQVCLFSFAEYAKRHENLTSDRQRIVDALNRIRTGGMTNIGDALFEAVNYLARETPNTRHAVILISDNKQTARSFVSERELITQAQETDAVIYSIKTSGIRPGLVNQLPSMVVGNPLDRITEETGGEVVKAENVVNLDKALQTIISRLITRYTLAYYPSRSSQGKGFHTITVRLAPSYGKAGRDYFILAKRGYYSIEAADLLARE